MIRKRLIPVVLAALLCFSMFACNKGDSNSSPAADTDSGAANSGTAQSAGTGASAAEPTLGSGETITWMLPSGTIPDDLDRINTALSDYLKSIGYNLNLELQYYTWANYDTQLSTMIASGEKFDLFNYYIGGANQYGVNGGITEITGEMLDAYGQDIKSVLGDVILQKSSYNGTLYMVPVNKDMAVSYGFVYNQTIADQYNLDVSSVKSMSDWTAIFETLHAQDPNVICYLTNLYDADIQMAGMVEYVNGSGSLCAGMPLDAADGKIVNIWKSQSVIDGLNTMRDWYEAGYMNTDTTADLNALVSEGKVFAYPSILKPGKADELTTDTTAWAQVDITSAMVTSSTYPGTWGTSISGTSEYADDALALLNLAYRDSKFLNLIVYGEEDKDYTVNADGRITVTGDSSGYNQSGNIAWEFGNQHLDLLKDTESLDKWTQLDTFNAEALKHIANLSGFWFNAEDFSTETAAITSVYKEYLPLLVSGAVDVDSTLQKMYQELDNSGMQAVLDSMNEQYQTFLSSEKSQ